MKNILNLISCILLAAGFLISQSVYAVMNGQMVAEKNSPAALLEVTLKANFQSKVYYKTYYASASLIAPDVVLTCAHCVGDGIYDLRVSGKDYSVKYKVHQVRALFGIYWKKNDLQSTYSSVLTHIATHPDWDADKQWYDIALWRSSKVFSSSEIKPVRLPDLKELRGVVGDSLQDEFVTAFGYGMFEIDGLTDQPYLRKGAMKSPANQCSEYDYQPWGKDDKDILFCTKSLKNEPMTLSGDSGGPVFRKIHTSNSYDFPEDYFQVGVTTSVNVEDSRKYNYGFYTRFNSRVNTWIKSNIAKKTNICTKISLWALDFSRECALRTYQATINGPAEYTPVYTAGLDTTYFDSLRMSYRLTDKHIGKISVRVQLQSRRNNSASWIPEGRVTNVQINSSEAGMQNEYITNPFTPEPGKSYRYSVQIVCNDKVCKGFDLSKPKDSLTVTTMVAATYDDIDARRR